MVNNVFNFKIFIIIKNNNIVVFEFFKNFFCVDFLDFFNCWGDICLFDYDEEDGMIGIFMNFVIRVIF